MVTSKKTIVLYLVINFEFYNIKFLNFFFLSTANSTQMCIIKLKLITLERIDEYVPVKDNLEVQTSFFITKLKR